MEFAASKIINSRFICMQKYFQIVSYKNVCHIMALFIKYVFYEVLAGFNSNNPFCSENY